MTREEALSKWEMLGQQISDLQRERQDLRQIILGEVLTSQRTNPYALYPKVKLSSKGLRARKAICDAIQKHGEATVGEIKRATGLRDPMIYTCLQNLRASNVIRVEGPRGQQRYFLLAHTNNEVEH